MKTYRVYSLFAVKLHLDVLDVCLQSIR